MPRVVVIGLDGLAPGLVFGELTGQLPCLTELARAGVAGPMLSSMPPITVPAWACMFTGLDPGELGLYGFHDRADRGYSNRRLASSLSFNAPPLWQLAGRAGKRVRVLGVPQTYPPKPVRGALVAGMPTPAGAETITYPAELRAELDALCGGWRDDVSDFRARPKAELYAELVALADCHFTVARDWTSRGDWDLFVFVTIAPDRVHHVFWAEPTAPEVIDFYRYLDGQLGALLSRFAPDDIVMVVSDHGAQTNRGGFALNDFLRQRGDLVLHAEPERVTTLRPELVDWARTRAWADGGYVGRIYINLVGREPEGVLTESERGAYLAALAADLGRIRGSDRDWRNQVIDPRQLYAATHGMPPDLLVVFDDLAIRPLATVGHATLHPRDNDRGPDAANHAEHGILILRDGQGPRAAPAGLSLYDVTPTALACLGVPSPGELRGRALCGGDLPASG